MNSNFFVLWEKYYVAGCIKCAQQWDMNLNTQTEGKNPYDVSIYI